MHLPLTHQWCESYRVDVFYYTEALAEFLQAISYNACYKCFFIIEAVVRQLHW